MMMQAILDELDVLAPDCHDAMLINTAVVQAADSDIEPLLQGWAAAFGHKLRIPERRNSFQWLSHDDAVTWVNGHLTRDLVFGTVGMEAQKAAALTAQLFDHLGRVQALTSNFVISDWTFCDVIVMSNASATLLLAFLGED